MSADPGASTVNARGATGAGRRPAPLAVVVLLVGLVLTAVLTWLTWTINGHNESRLLSLQTREAAAAVAGGVPDIETPLASAVEIAEATGGDAAKYDTFMAAYVGSGHPFASSSLWRLGSSGAVMVAAIGSPAGLAQRQQQIGAVFADHRPGGALTVDGMVDGGRRLAYSFGSVAGSPRYVAYAQSPIAPDHRLSVPRTSAFSDLNFVVYLGHTQRPGSLLVETVAAIPPDARRTVVAVPFGNTVLTVVATPTTDLGGALLNRLPWIVVVGGVILSVLAALTSEWLVRRRRTAEMLATENRRLYGQQRSIAEQLQHALLPDDAPDLSPLPLESASTYVAGTDGLDIGGDWYDVVPCGDDGFLFAVGDVSGRGLRAATVMASLRYAIRAYAAEGHPPEVILTKLCHLLDLGRDGHFATVLCGYVDLGHRRMALANAGHLPPLLSGPSGSTFVQAAGGPPIGVNEDERYGAVSVELPAGGTLLAFTDGLVERRGESLQLGLQRLRDAACGAEEPLGAAVARLVAELTPGGPSDDVAILALRWHT